MSNIIRQLEETTAFLRGVYPHVPAIGIILGSGLGNFAAHIRSELEIPYEAIPNFPVSTVEGHRGRLIFGTVAGKKVVAMAGRFHFYEGYSAEQVVFPVRLMKFLGVETLLVSNAAGGVNPGFAVGDLMAITDHISFAVVNPLLGKNESQLGPRFPDMSEPYNKELIKSMKEIAAGSGIKLQQGVYFGVTGPTFETRAEYLMINRLGGDAVGMSTVQEVITANHMGMKVAAVSVITDLGIREEDNVITHEEVLQAAAEAEPKLTTLFTKLIEKL
ncbi:purine-nucleoside phosphorylase [Pseudobacter ginsenosidimutans]|uniref:Purine nucleoside phosphorylase n=1 Tax=Pseudobacter ginsenosidimutans TaxID=661488 RepID=A0A4V2F1T3_9BACT|nr:purine-nucleoside phosphorylase [Pseudobacter ginsenosidimutans]QEC43489.1 purine-nucleoside phosphorylase [Pseudobacter ginsenosidimutans]RZS74876.1 purine-nucleoside phosphorylase [Pseudobacter ginsenosidimutans]